MPKNLDRNTRGDYNKKSITVLCGEKVDDLAEDKETKKKLLDSAKQEFLEKGYMKASLRTICKNAGVTTGALYFFFQNKEDLLRELVEEPLQGLIALMQQHLSEELEEGVGIIDLSTDTKDVHAAKKIVSFMYRHYDIFLILLAKSQGSRYEDMVSRFAEWGEQHYTKLSTMAAEKYGVPKPDKYLIYWMTYVQVHAFTHLLMHEPDVKKALAHIEQIVIFLVSGWNGMVKNRYDGI